MVGDHAYIHLFLSRQSYASDNARTHINQGAVGPWNVSVRIEPLSPRSNRPRRFLQQGSGHLALKNLVGQVPAFLSAQWTRCDDPRRGESFDWRGNVVLTSFAGKHKRMFGGIRAGEHGRIIGEDKANVIHRDKED
jgi:hypothetical protein